MDWQQVFGVIFGVLVIYLALAIRWVPRPYNWVIEVNLPGGMHSYVWEPGLHFLWIPIKPLMYVRNKVDMAQKPVTLHMGMKDGIGRPDPVDFKDAKAGVMAQVIYQVINPIDATYNVQEGELDVISHDDSGKETVQHFFGYERATLNRAEAALRSFFGSLEFDAANEDGKKDEIEAGVLDAIKQSVKGSWGVEIFTIDIIDFILDDETAKIRQGRLAAKVTAEVARTTAEGEKQAAILRAQGQKEATVTVAEGERTAAQLAGQGEQERLRAVHGAGLDPASAAAYVIAREANQAIANGNATIIATSEGGNMNFAATVAGIAKGMLGGGNNTPPTPGNPPPPAPAPSPAPVATPQTPHTPRRRS